MMTGIVEYQYTGWRSNHWARLQNRNMDKYLYIIDAKVWCQITNIGSDKSHGKQSIFSAKY